MRERRVIARIPAVRVRLGGDAHSGWLPRNAAEPLQTPVREVRLSVEIEDFGGSFLLLYRTTDGSPYADTWHRTLGEAKQTAADDLGVQPTDWQSVD